MGRADAESKTVDVWSVANTSAAARLTRLWEVLSRDERERAMRFGAAHLRDRFVGSRAATRFVLSGYLDRSAGAISFVYGRAGKPMLASEGNVEFNLSHSGDRVVIAVAHGCAVGIDLEQLRPVRDRGGILRRYFCAEEAAEILSLPACKQERAFFCCWTRKESYMKAVGEGFGLSLDSFRVSTEPDSVARLIHVDGDVRGSEGWTMQDLHLDAQYSSALTYRDTGRDVRLFAVEADDLLSR